MLDKNTFARNEDGTLKTKKGCETPGCRYPNWHVCSGPTIPDADEMPKRRGGSNFMEKFDEDPTRRERVNAGHRARLAQLSAKTSERNRELVKDRSAGMSYFDLSRKYTLAESSVRAIVSRVNA